MGKSLSQDIRLKIGFPNNPKTKRLTRALGDAGFAAMIRLWCYVGEHFPTGTLKCTEDEIEDFAGWTGIRGEYVAYTLSNQWVIRVSDTEYLIHDWREHQPWVYHRDKRSEMARNAVNTRWEKRKRKQQVNTERIRNVYEANTESNTPLPIPSPSPLPKNHGFTLPPIIRPEVWAGFEDMRKRIRKPMTDNARKLIIGKLKRLGGDPNIILEESTMNGWAGVFPLKEQDKIRQPVDCIGRPI